MYYLLFFFLVINFKLEIFKRIKITVFVFFHLQVYKEGREE